MIDYIFIGCVVFLILLLGFVVNRITKPEKPKNIKTEWSVYFYKQYEYYTTPTNTLGIETKYEYKR